MSTSPVVTSCAEASAPSVFVSSVVSKLVTVGSLKVPKLGWLKIVGSASPASGPMYTLEAWICATTKSGTNSAPDAAVPVTRPSVMARWM